MSILQIHPDALIDAHERLELAATAARAEHSSEHLTTAAGAIPGAASVAHLGELGDSWEVELRDWSTRVGNFAEHVLGFSEEMRAVDETSAFSYLAVHLLLESTT